MGGKAMVLDPIILPLSHLCFAPSGQNSRKFETVGSGRREGGNYDSACINVLKLLRERDLAL